MSRPKSPSIHSGVDRWLRRYQIFAVDDFQLRLYYESSDICIGKLNAIKQADNELRIDMLQVAPATEQGQRGCMEHILIHFGWQFTYTDQRLHGLGVDLLRALRKVAQTHNISQIEARLDESEQAIWLPIYQAAEFVPTTPEADDLRLVWSA